MQGRFAALAGVAGAIAGLAVAELGSGLLHMRVSPVLAVGEAIIEITPGAVAETAISAVGQWDKPLLVAGVVIGLLVSCALGGYLLWRRQIAGMAVFVALGAIAVVSVGSRGDSGQADIIVPFIGAAVTLFVASRLITKYVVVRTDVRAGDLQGAVPAQRQSVLDTEREMATRRSFLTMVGTVAAVSVVIGGAGRWLASARSGVEQARARLRLAVPEVTTPEGVEAGVDGIAPWLSPNDSFYRIDTSLSPPLIRPEDWQLRIHGMVDKEIVLTYEDLVNRGLEQHWVTLCCVSNPVGGTLVGNAEWSGVRIADILAEVGISPDADALLSTSDDGWTCGTPLSVLTDGRDALLAVAMNGKPLPVEHGFPVRQVVPGLYGYVSATKWVVDWEITTFDQFTAYWTDRGWSAEGPVKTQSRIDTPLSARDGVDVGIVPVGGVAWAQHTGIAKVEVRVDEGEWNTATLARVPSTDTWVQWTWDWDAKAGAHALEVRATDTSGFTQTPGQVDVIPDGAEGYHRIVIAVA